MSYIPGQPVTAVVQRVEIHKLRQGENLILGFSIGGGIDQDPAQNPFSEDKTDKVSLSLLRPEGFQEMSWWDSDLLIWLIYSLTFHQKHTMVARASGSGWDASSLSEDLGPQGIYVTRVTEGGPAEVAGLQVGDKIMQVNGWDMTMVTHDQARKRLTKRNEEVVRLLVTRHSLQKAVQQSMMSPPCH
ncbi:Tax1-binding protein 3 [Varanus komodoensis]|nr:Tax1-binding protein 3 [Varanus komodoensis]